MIGHDMRLSAILVWVLCAFASYLGAEPAKVISVGFAEFPPYAAFANGKPSGFTVEIVKEALAHTHLAVKFQEVSSWSEAVNKTTQGELDGLLAPTHQEAPHLIFPKHALALQGECFYVKQTDTWQPTHASSFIGRKTIVFPGWSHEAKFIKRLSDKVYHQAFIHRHHNSDYDINNMQMVMAGDANAFWEDPNAFNTYRRDEKAVSDLKRNFKMAGCLHYMKLYLGLTPVKQTQSDRVAKAFDEGFERLKATGRIDEIKRQYHVLIPD